MQHKISLKPNIKHVRQKLRRLNRMLLPIIEREIIKLLKANIIIPLRFFDQVENIVPVRKKNSEIRICIDFRNLNKYFLKNNYQLHKMDCILKKVVGLKIISMIDGY